MGRSTRARKRDARPGRLTYEALAELFRRAGPTQRVMGTSAYTLDHLRRFFGRRLPESSTIVDYVRRRQKERAPIQTINDELWSLAWMFRCALQQGKLKQEDCPRIEFLKEPRPEVVHPRMDRVYGGWVPALKGGFRQTAAAPQKEKRRQLPNADLRKYLDGIGYDWKDRDYWKKHPERTAPIMVERIDEDLGYKMDESSFTRKVRALRQAVPD